MPDVGRQLVLGFVQSCGATESPNPTCISVTIITAAGDQFSIPLSQNKKTIQAWMANNS
jgi:hypothetical protein